MVLLICRKDAVEWLTDERWIALCFYNGFTHYLEQCYFTPGTPKSTEFEIIVALVALQDKGMCAMAPFCRIKGTPDNRELLRASLSEFHGKRLLPVQQLSANIQELRQQTKENIIRT